MNLAAVDSAFDRLFGRDDTAFHDACARARQQREEHVRKATPLIYARYKGTKERLVQAFDSLNPEQVSSLLVQFTRGDKAEMGHLLHHFIDKALEAQAKWDAGEDAYERYPEPEVLP